MIGKTLLKSGYSQIYRHRRRLPAKAMRKMQVALTELTADPTYPLVAPRFIQQEMEACLFQVRERFPASTVYFLTDTALTAPGNSIRINSPVDVPEQLNPKVFICAFEDDERYASTLRQITGLQDAFYYAPARAFPPARYFHRNSLAKQVLKKEASIGLSHFDLGDFENIVQMLEETRDIEGDYLEIGVFQGASAHLAMSYMSEAGIDRTAYFLDVFEGFVFETAAESQDATWYGTHTSTSLEAVTEFLSPYPKAHVLKADIIKDPLPPAIGRLALCNIDVDLYEAVLAALTRVAPLIAVGGAILVEDYGHTPLLGGALLATQEFLGYPISGDFRKIYLQSGQLLLIRIKDAQELAA